MSESQGDHSQSLSQGYSADLSENGRIQDYCIKKSSSTNTSYSNNDESSNGFDTMRRTNSDNSGNGYKKSSARSQNYYLQHQNGTNSGNIGNPINGGNGSINFQNVNSHGYSQTQRRRKTNAFTNNGVPIQSSLNILMGSSLHPGNCGSNLMNGTLSSAQNTQSSNFHSRNNSVYPPYANTHGMMQGGEQMTSINHHHQGHASNPQKTTPNTIQRPVFSGVELNNQILLELNCYKEEQENRKFSSWASLLNENQEGDDIGKTEFYQESLLKQLETSSEKVELADLKHFQVDISEQDNNGPFEYLKQFRLESSGDRSMQEDYLDLINNIDVYTEKLYYAIQDKASEHLRKSNLNPAALLTSGINNNNGHNYSSQQWMQGQRNGVKQIIRGAVQTVLEYSENRTVVPRYAREGDWLCQCGNLNFSYRNICNKCLVMKARYQYTRNTELNIKLDLMEKQLLNIDSTITSPPPTDQIITQQRQIILSDFIWICKCCRSINYSKTNICISCKMYKFIDKTKLAEITKNSQKKLAKYAKKFAERQAKLLQKADNKSQLSNTPSQQLNASISEEMSSLNVSLQVVPVEDLNSSTQQLLLLNTSTDCDSKSPTRPTLLPLLDLEAEESLPHPIRKHINCPDNEGDQILQKQFQQENSISQEILSLEEETQEFQADISINSNPDSFEIDSNTLESEDSVQINRHQL